MCVCVFLHNKCSFCLQQIIQTLVCAVVQMDMDGFTADHLRAILNDNFLELNDLAD